MFYTWAYMCIYKNIYTYTCMIFIWFKWFSGWNGVLTNTSSSLCYQIKNERTRQDHVWGILGILGDILGIFVIWCGIHMVGFIIATVEIKTTEIWSSIFCLLGAEFYCVSMVEISIKESLNELWFCLRDEQEKKMQIQNNLVIF